jgi:hypothetical protein
LLQPLCLLPLAHPLMRWMRLLRSSARSTPLIRALDMGDALI